MTAPPSLRWLTSPDDVPEELRRGLTACWRDVANAGGAVGFAELLPVDDADVRPAVDAITVGLDPALSRLLVAQRGSTLVGWLVVTGNSNPVLAHWARVTRVQTALDARGTGVARALLTELHRAARDDLGLERLRLEVRGAAGLEAFYARFGWTVVGVWPSALQIAPGDRRDEVLMDLDLRS